VCSASPCAGGEGFLVPVSALVVRGGVCGASPCAEVRVVSRPGGERGVVPALGQDVRGVWCPDVGLGVRMWC